MKQLHAIIADDEPLARARLRDLLEPHPEIEIVAEAEDGAAALELVQKHSPDLIFLDVQMPGLTGFEVLEELGENPPIVIFVTAYDQFALKAFDLCAVDYLLKPVDEDRFTRAIERAFRWAESRSGLNKQLQELLDQVRPSRPLTKLAIKGDGKLILVSLNDIDWVEAADNYVNVHTPQASHLHRETLASLEKKLAPRFVRTARSALVNKEHIVELLPLFRGDYTIKFKSGLQAPLNRSFKKSLEEWLGD